MPLKHVVPTRPTGVALVQTLARAGRPTEQIIEELEQSEEYRKKKLEEDRKGEGPWGFVPDLDGWDMLAEEVGNLPPEVGIALMTGRHQLIIGMSPTRVREVGDNTQAVVGLLNLIRVLLATNAALKKHGSVVAQRADHAYGNLKATVVALDNLRSLAAFEGPVDHDD